MQELDQIFHRLRSRSLGAKGISATCSTKQNEYSCAKCKDREFFDRGDGVFVMCVCRKQKQLERRIRSSMIDKTFSDATFENFTPEPHTLEMFITAKEYVANFETIRHERHNGIGYMARVGESAIRQVSDPVKREILKSQHNSYGLGKTHLQTVISLMLLRRGVQVLMVNDTDIVAELRAGQFAEDAEYYERKVDGLCTAELLIWDDLGKQKPSEWVVNQYYRVFNYRYRNGLPICFSTNEDRDSLSERIGEATASRLLAMCKGRIVLCEGTDFRLR